MSLVSVIVPTRDSGRTLETCLRSIRAQSYSSIELIVVDNDSHDMTPVIAKQYADVFDDWGPERSAQRNHGARIAKGEFLLFIDSDMELMPSVVDESVAVITTVQAPAVVIPETSDGEGFWARCRALERSCYVDDTTVESARFFSRSSFEMASGFDEDLVAFEDRDLSLRVANNSALPRISAHILHHEGKLRLSNALAKKRYYAAAFIRYWRRHRTTALNQANIIVRPAFLRNWRALVRHPILTPGLIMLKTLETCAAISGAFQVGLRK